MSSFSNLAITATNGAFSSAMGQLFSTLQSKIANGGRDTNCKFYYGGPGASGSILQVATKGLIGGVVSALKDEVDNGFKSLLNGKKRKTIHYTQWNDDQLKHQKEEKSKYGRMRVVGGTVYALDDWGGIAPDALMLCIETDKEISVYQTWPRYDTYQNLKGEYREIAPKRITNKFKTKELVWYDTTALITINSDKNVVVSRIQGRDYSRKELVSNGDIKFTVSGQITSGMPDIYPESEIKKFIKVMQYKGVVRVNNQILDQFGITHILITDFNISPREGYKALQNYTFSAIGLQPESEIQIEEDTVAIYAQANVDTKEQDQSEWMKMLNNQLDGLKSMAGDLFSQSTALASGMLDKAL
jgi:hypothetical protein